MQFVDVAFVVVSSWIGPVGKLIVSLSYVTGSVNLWRIGMFMIAVLVPIGTAAAYSVCPRVFVAPIHSTEALVATFLAWQFLAEGRNMGIHTVRGLVVFVTGLICLMAAYTRHLDTNTVDVVNWSRFVLFTGAMLLAQSCTLWSAVAVRWAGGRAPWCWVVLAGIMGGYDYVVSADTWLVPATDLGRVGVATWLEAVCLAVFVCVNGVGSVAVLDWLLAHHPMHVVAPAVQAMELVINVVADVYVYGRWVEWGVASYLLAGTGVGLMAQGIRRLTPIS
jgi:hypothetical protein